jgi:hypothetical protein
MPDNPAPPRYGQGSVNLSRWEGVHGYLTCNAGTLRAIDRSGALAQRCLAWACTRLIKALGLSHAQRFGLPVCSILT